jgi:hypothetical protein
MGKWIRGTETVQGARKALPSSEGASRRSVQSGHVGHQSAQQKRRPVCSTQAATGCDRFPLAFNVAEMQTIFVNRAGYAIQYIPRRMKKRAGLTCKFQISQRRPAETQAEICGEGCCHMPPVLHEQAVGPRAHWRLRVNRVGSPQFPNKTRSTLTRDRFCGPEHPGTSHLRVVYRLVGFCGTHGESGHDRVQSARVGLA